MVEIFKNLPENFITFLLSPSPNEWLSVIRIIFIVISAFLAGVIIFTLFRCSWLKFIFLQDVVEILTYKPFGIKKIEKDWRKIVSRLDTGMESEYKLAIIEADDMMDETLKRMGYGGESLGERLEKLTAATLSNIEEIKEAHKVRNNIVHDPNYKLSLEETKKTLAIFEKAFKDLEAF